MSITITQMTVVGLETITDADDLAGVILEATCTVTIEGVVDLDALRFEGEPLDPSAWDDPDLEDACNWWATAHRVFVNGTQLFGATTVEGELVFVSGGGIRPQETWGEVIAVYWDSSVFQGPQEGVGLAQRLPVLPAHVAAGSQRRQGTQGRGDPQRPVGATVHQLHQLHRELHVAQPARAELQLTARLLGRDVFQDAASHRLHIGHEAVPLGRGPDELGGHVGPLDAQGQVAGDRPGLQQGLELPGLGPALVVAAVAGQGPGERPRSTLRTQVRIDRPDGALGGLLGADLDQMGGQLGRGPGGQLVIGGGTLRVGARLVDEDHVHVGDVVELVTSALAHRQHREPHAGGGLAHPGPGHGQTGLQGAGRQVREFSSGVTQRQVVGQVAGRETKQQPSVLHPERVQCLGIGQGGHR